MKIIILFIAFILIGCSGSMAQEPSKSTPPPISHEEGTKILVDHISPKLNLTKGQKDSLAIIYLRFMDDVQKYHAENNEKVFAYMLKARDERVKNLLRDSIKYDKYLLILEDIKKQPLPVNDSRQSHPQDGGHNRRGGSGTGGGRSF